MASWWTSFQSGSSCSVFTSGATVVVVVVDGSWRGATVVGEGVTKGSTSTSISSLTGISGEKRAKGSCKRIKDDSSGLYGGLSGS